MASRSDDLVQPAVKSKLSAKLSSSLSLALSEAGLHDFAEELSEQEKKRRRLRTLAILALPVVAAFVLGCVLLSGGYGVWNDGKAVSRQLEMYQPTAELVRGLQVERVWKIEASQSCSACGPVRPSETPLLTSDPYNETDTAIESMPWWPPPERLSPLDDFKTDLLQTRARSLTSETEVHHVLTFYKDSIGGLTAWLLEGLGETSMRELWRHLGVYHSLVCARNHAADECTYLACDNFTLGGSDVENKAIRKESTRGIQLSIRFALDNCRDCRQRLQHITDNLSNQLSTADHCLSLVDDLGDVTADHLARTIKSLRDILSKAESKIIWSILAVLVSATLCPLLAWHYAQSEESLDALRVRYLRVNVLRVNELRAEAKKVDSLLYQLLPKAIAEDLKSEKAVLAESYQSVTIYFSDVVGFTAIAAASTPIQVVDFLNKLYTEFDRRIDLYDVYKVETIGDAYMLVSGCPRTNGIRHAGEVATLSLDLLNMIKDFKIPHLPDKILMLRIGLHSGPCVAGVVGEKMPRYCLFGDTVNIASRMESTGQPMRIQVSDECKKLLDQLGKYEIVDRGQIEVKENVFVKSHWLTGKDGYSFKLNLDVCVFIPKKVKLDRVIVTKKSLMNSSLSIGRGKGTPGTSSSGQQSQPDSPSRGDASGLTTKAPGPNSPLVITQEDRDQEGSVSRQQQNCGQTADPNNEKTLRQAEPKQPGKPIPPRSDSCVFELTLKLPRIKPCLSDSTEVKENSDRSVEHAPAITSDAGTATSSEPGGKGDLSMVSECDTLAESEPVHSGNGEASTADDQSRHFQEINRRNSSAAVGVPAVKESRDQDEPSDERGQTETFTTGPRTVERVGSNASEDRHVKKAWGSFQMSAEEVVDMASQMEGFGETGIHPGNRQRSTGDSDYGPATSVYHVQKQDLDGDGLKPADVTNAGTRHNETLVGQVEAKIQEAKNLVAGLQSDLNHFEQGTRGEGQEQVIGIRSALQRVACEDVTPHGERNLLAVARVNNSTTCSSKGQAIPLTSGNLTRNGSDLRYVDADKHLSDAPAVMHHNIVCECRSYRAQDDVQARDRYSRELQSGALQQTSDLLPGGTVVQRLRSNMDRMAEDANALSALSTSRHNRELRVRSTTDLTEQVSPVGPSRRSDMAGEEIGQENPTIKGFVGSEAPTLTSRVEAKLTEAKELLDDLRSDLNVLETDITEEIEQRVAGARRALHELTFDLSTEYRNDSFPLASGRLTHVIVQPDIRKSQSMAQPPHRAIVCECAQHAARKLAAFSSSRR